MCNLFLVLKFKFNEWNKEDFSLQITTEHKPGGFTEIICPRKRGTNAHLITRVLFQQPKESEKLKMNKSRHYYKHDLLTDMVIQKVYFEVFKWTKTILSHKDSSPNSLHLTHNCWEYKLLHLLQETINTINTITKDIEEIEMNNTLLKLKILQKEPIVE